MGVLDNKIAIVTGGGGGIGSAIANRLASEGGKIAVADMDTPAAQACAAAIVTKGGQAIPISADVTKKVSVEQMVQETLACWKRIDILVNVAGGADRKNVVDVTPEEWDHIIEMNLKSVFLCSQAVLPAHGRGKVRQDRQHLVDLWLHR